MKPALLAALLVFNVSGYTQQSQELPTVEIKMLEYVWEGVGYDIQSISEKRLVLLTDEQTRLIAQSAMRSGFQRNWKLDTSYPLSVKRLSLVATSPKFKVKVKEKSPGKILLYLQLFDKYLPPIYDDDTVLSTDLKVKYKLVKGDDASTIADKEFNVSVWRLTCASGGQVLYNIPFFPAQVTQLFDSIASWVSSANELRKNFEFHPACAYSATALPGAPAEKIFFKANSSDITLTTPRGLELKIYTPTYVKTDVKKNVGGNTLGGAFTLFTGISVDKKRIYSYNATFRFGDGQRIYECTVPYTEIEIAESERVTNEDGSKSLERGDYFLAARTVDTSAWHSITVLGDTLAKFRMSFIRTKNNIDSIWNGIDSSTISPLNNKWKPANSISDVQMHGTLGSQPFSMTSANGRVVKTFAIDNRPLITFYGIDKPSAANVYEQLTEEQFKLATILASVPYGIFNWTASGY